MDISILLQVYRVLPLSASWEVFTPTPLTVLCSGNLCHKVLYVAAQPPHEKVSLRWYLAACYVTQFVIGVACFLHSLSLSTHVRTF